MNKHIQYILVRGRPITKLDQAGKEIERLHFIINKAINYINVESWYCYKDNKEVIDRISTKKILEILDEVNKL